MSALSGGGGGIKSIQRGTTTLGSQFVRTITIAAVDPDKSYIVCHGFDQSRDCPVACNLISSTEVEFRIQSTGSARVSWQVIEHA